MIPNFLDIRVKLISEYGREDIYELCDYNNEDETTYELTSKEGSWDGYEFETIGDLIRSLEEDIKKRHIKAYKIYDLKEGNTCPCCDGERKKTWNYCPKCGYEIKKWDGEKCN
jgi:hypothetical protein